MAWQVMTLERHLPTQLRTRPYKFSIEPRGHRVIAMSTESVTYQSCALDRRGRLCEQAPANAPQRARPSSVSIAGISSTSRFRTWPSAANSPRRVVAITWPPSHFSTIPHDPAGHPPEPSPAAWHASSEPDHCAQTPSSSLPGGQHMPNACPDRRQPRRSCRSGQ